LGDAGVEVNLNAWLKIVTEIGRAIRYARRLGFQPDGPAKRFSNPSEDAVRDEILAWRTAFRQGVKNAKANGKCRRQT